MKIRAQGRPVPATPAIVRKAAGSRPRGVGNPGLDGTASWTAPHLVRRSPIQGKHTCAGSGWMGQTRAMLLPRLVAGCAWGRPLPGSRVGKRAGGQPIRVPADAEGRGRRVHGESA